MSVYYKFKSARDFDSMSITGHFISVGYLKERIFESKQLGKGRDFDLMVSNAQTNEEYVDENTLIPRNTSVLVRRIPGCPRKPIVAQQDKPIVDKVEEVPQPMDSMPIADSSSMKVPEESEWDEFGDDLYAIPETQNAQSCNPVVDAPPSSTDDEESKIKALVETPALDWQNQPQEYYGHGRGYGRGIGGRMMAGRGFGRGGFGSLDRKTPPEGYICHRCKVSGHFIQHCPTNGDPNYDIKRMRPPTGIPKTMLVASLDGSYALPSGMVAVLKPNEAAFEKEIDGLPSTRPVTDLPPELHCPLCKEVMKDAVLTGKCCFSSFCDKCIRDHIISKSMCVCGATNVLADDLLPNKTLRETINRILESSTTSSAENAGSLSHVQDMESARPLPPKAPSPTLSSTKEEHTEHPLSHPPKIEDENENEGKEASVVTLSPGRVVGQTRLPEATPESIIAQEHTSKESVPAPVDEAKVKMPGIKKKKRKAQLPCSASDMQWRTFQDFGLENFSGMPSATSSYNPYFNGMPWGMDGYMAPFPASMPLMGYYPQGSFDVPFGGVLPQGPFAGQGYMMPVPPQRYNQHLPDMKMVGVKKNPISPVMGREELESRKARMGRDSELERHGEREPSKDRESNRDVNGNAENSYLKPKPRSSKEEAGDRSRREKSPVRRPISAHYRASPPPPKRRSEQDDQNKHRAASVFSRLNDDASDDKKRRRPRDDDRAALHSERRLDGSGPRSRGSYDRESSEDCHFKRRPSTSRSSREREHDHDGRLVKRRR